MRQPESFSAEQDLKEFIGILRYKQISLTPTRILINNKILN